jgi:uncharacterized protein YbaR (Trm112 family)
MSASPKFDPKMLEMLVCPLTHTQLIYEPDAAELVSRAARLAFPIRDVVPLMVLDEARAVSEEELNRFEA